MGGPPVDAAAKVKELAGILKCLIQESATLSNEIKNLEEQVKLKSERLRQLRGVYFDEGEISIVKRRLASAQRSVDDLQKIRVKWMNTLTMTDYVVDKVTSKLIHIRDLGGDHVRRFTLTGKPYRRDWEKDEIDMYATFHGSEFENKVFNA